MNYIGEKCPFCENNFEENEEIVICNSCKIPHHKVCWNANSGCTSYACNGKMLSIAEYEELMNSVHSTVNDSAEKRNLTENELQICSRCGSKISVSDIKCPKCKYPLIDDDSVELDSFMIYNNIQKTKQAKKELNINKTKKKKRAGILLVPLFILLLITAFFAFYVTDYQGAIKDAEEHNFSSAQDKIELLSFVKFEDKQLEKYIKAGILYEQGKYKDAAQEFFDSGDYMDSQDMTLTCVLAYADELDNTKKYEEEIEWYQEVKEKYGFPFHYVDITYELKQKAIAYNSELEKEDRKRIEKRIEEIEQAAVRPKLNKTDLKTGNIVQFGRYEQDGIEGNGKENIDWIVLSANNGKALLLSKKGLDYKPYNETDDYVTWEDCSLRRWLNQDFLNDAFIDEEQDIIFNESIVTDDEDGLTITTDKVFCLSVNEANKYFGSSKSKSGFDDDIVLCKPTKYTANQWAIVDYQRVGEKLSYKKATTWWLRNTSDDYWGGLGASNIFLDGLEDNYHTVTSVDVYLAIRPAIYVYYE